MARLLIALLFGFAALATSTHAEIAKIEKICTADGQTKLCPIYLPSFKAPEGWIVERNKTMELNVGMFVPKGRNFDNTPVRIYTDARVLRSGINLARWVAENDAKWTAETPGTVITDLPPGDLGAGKRDIILHHYENKKLIGQQSEIIAHFVENDAEGNAYVVRLVVSGVDEKTVNAVRPTFDTMLKNY